MMPFHDARQIQSTPSLTGIRGVAALWVMLFHVQAHAVAAFGPAMRLPGSLIAHGWSAVDMFFVLSGFVLMQAYGGEFVRLHAFALLRFAKLRVARVYPLSLVVLLLILPLALDTEFVAWFRAGDASNLTPTALVKTALLATRWFLPGREGNWNEPVWSLSVEMLGYAAFPWLARFLGARRSVTFVLATVAVFQSVLVGYLIVKHGTDENMYGQGASVIRMGCCLITGAAAARARTLMPWLAAFAAPLSVASVGMLLLAATCIPGGPVVMPLLYAVLIFALSFRRGPIDRALSSAPARFLGRISFPLYLLHMTPLLWLIHQLQLWQLSAGFVAAALMCYMLVCVAAAAVLHIGVERPAQNWGRRWAMRPQVALHAPAQA